MFVIEDEAHAEWCGQYPTREEAVAELKARSMVPWDKEPNVAPCTSWRTCGREYVLVEFDAEVDPCKELSRKPALSVSSAGAKWEAGFVA